MNKILLATSIAPFDLENQKNAVQSWVDAGFEVISCNIATEIESLKNHFPQVEFVEMNRNGREVGGKPCPFISDILQTLKKKGTDICGIINSDIHLRKINEEMLSAVREVAQEAVVYLRRQEIEDLTVLSGEVKEFHTYLFGIDAFFLHTKNIDKFDDIGMIIGQSMWDYWFLIAANCSGLPIVELANPVAFHVSHEIKWDEQASARLSVAICDRYFEDVEETEAREFVGNKHLELLSKVTDIFCFLPKGFDLEKYELSVPYSGEKLYLSKVYRETVFWTMEEYGIDEACLRDYYWIERDTGNLSLNNCHVNELNQYRDNLLPIKAYRRSAKEKEDRRTANLGICTQGWYIEDERKNNLEKNKVSGKVFVFPAGYMGEHWAKRYEKLVEVKGFIDNYTAGRVIRGKQVYAPEILKDAEQYDKVVIVTNLYEKEIYEQALNYCSKDKIVCWRELF